MESPRRFLNPSATCSSLQVRRKLRFRLRWRLVALQGTVSAPTFASSQRHVVVYLKHSLPSQKLSPSVVWTSEKRFHTPSSRTVLRSKPHRGQDVGWHVAKNIKPRLATRKQNAQNASRLVSCLITDRCLGDQGFHVCHCTWRHLEETRCERKHGQ